MYYVQTYVLFAPGPDLDGRVMQVKTGRKMPEGFDPQFYVRAADLARDGKTDKQIGRALGVGEVTWKGWVGGKAPGLREILDEARAVHSPEKAAVEYVFGNVSADLRGWLRDSMLLEDAALDPVDREELQDRLQAGYRTMHVRTQQHLFLHVMVQRRFNVSEACRITGMAYARYVKWHAEDDNFRRLTAELRVHLKNWGQDALMKLVEQGNPAAVIFFNKTLNADMGYQVVKRVEGTLTHRTEAPLDDALMKLPLEDRKRILESLRAPKALPEHPPEPPVEEAEVLTPPDRDGDE